MWNEALNQAGVEASYAFRSAESVYYPLAIRALSSTNSKDDTAPEVAELGKDSLTKVPPPPPLLIALPRKPGSPRLLKKKLTQPREWPLMASRPQLFLKTYPKRRRYPPRWRLSWQLSLCLSRGTSRVRA